MSEHSEFKLTLVWGNDGWCYIPQLKVREKFEEKDYIQEDWDGVIAMPEHVESLTITEWLSSCDSLQLRKSILDIRMSVLSQQGLRQQVQLP